LAGLLFVAKFAASNNQAFEYGKEKVSDRVLRLIGYDDALVPAVCTRQK
jgi:hypothetical protein